MNFRPVNIQTCDLGSSAHAQLAVKGEYTFTFLDLEDAYSERELERALTERIGVIHLVNEDVPKPAKLPQLRM